jgi:nucleoside 2-deoxyribosyltransferase
MRALGRPIFGYTHDARPYLDRVAADCDHALRLRSTGEHEDPDGLAVEDFDQHDNLMLAGGIVASGGCLVTASVPHAEHYTSLEAFERCVAIAATTLGQSDRACVAELRRQFAQ